MSKLTIAIPTYNRLNYLKECLQSIALQTFKDFEIFVFDNASNPSIEDEVKKIDKRIHFIGNEKNVGSLGNIRRILKYPFKSEYLMIFHDDDYMHSKMLETQVNLLNRHKDMVFVGTNFSFSDGRKISEFNNNIGINTKNMIYKNYSEFIKALLNYTNLCFGSVMYRINAIRSFNFNDFNFESFSIIWDRPFLLELSKKGKCAYILDKLVNYRVHPSKDSKIGPLKEENIEQVLRLYKDNLPSPLNLNDRKLFYRYSTNSLLDSYTRMDRGLIYFFDYIKKYQEKKLFGWRYLNIYGIIALLKIALNRLKT